jgi:phage-related tail protein
MLDGLKDVLTAIALGSSAISVYVSLKSKADKAEIKSDFKEMLSDRTKLIYDRIESEIDKVEETIKSSINLKYHHIDQIKKQTNEIENFVMAEIKVLKTQIAERDIRLDKLEKKIDDLGLKMQDQFNHLNERIMDIRELIIGMASKK